MKEKFLILVSLFTLVMGIIFPYHSKCLGGGIFVDVEAEYVQQYMW
jgi:hypothetical protein